MCAKCKTCSLDILVHVPVSVLAYFNVGFPSVKFSEDENLRIGSAMALPIALLFELQSLLAPEEIKPILQCCDATPRNAVEPRDVMLRLRDRRLCKRR